LIALIGGNGSIGRRYQAVLNYIKEPYLVIEKDDDPAILDRPDITHAIIATPTETHMEWCERAAHKNIWFLCEKPLSKHREEIKPLLQKTGFVVNNWAFVSTNMNNTQANHLSYNFYNTGRDGLVWDVCQLVYLSHLANGILEVRTDSYEWAAHWNGVQVPYNFIEASYLQMVRAFITHDSKRLWSLADAYEMSGLCEEIIKQVGETCEGFVGHSSKKWWESIPRKSVRENRREASSSVVV